MWPNFGFSNVKIDRAENFAPFFSVKKSILRVENLSKSFQKLRQHLKGPDDSTITKIMAEKYSGPKLLTIKV